MKVTEAGIERSMNKELQPQEGYLLYEGQEELIRYRHWMSKKLLMVKIFIVLSLFSQW